ncbi:ATP-binding protein [Athalassotoga saccharophila]|uniref:ATP-binding protein n=1 Tax=Athalassotoga saccharophila TaxID=1441386 RepID=UPI001379BB3B|nr:ATP-binding protein [Athalassotoga saccharophila]BBJ28983.1 minD superfamily P-loop ATPase [Athalassotoga saccharophila]
MKITVLSGKGGTGKTTIATNLAYSLNVARKKVQLLDADVEEPNAHIFFNVNYNYEESVQILLPVIDRNLCTHCGICAKSCEFSAITVSPKYIMVFDNLCHGCGVCSMVCPVKAISERPKDIGTIKLGTTEEGIIFGEGIMNIGEPSPVRIIRQLKRHIDPSADVVILDAPPGTSCPVIETIHNTDFAIFVTEPTPFGLHDLKLAIESTREFNIPRGVVINRYDGSYKEVERYLDKEGIPILMTIPYDPEIARDYSTGFLFSKKGNYVDKFLDLFERVMTRC